MTMTMIKNQSGLTMMKN